MSFLGEVPRKVRRFLTRYLGTCLPLTSGGRIVDSETAQIVFIWIATGIGRGDRDALLRRGRCTVRRRKGRPRRALSRPPRRDDAADHGHRDLRGTDRP